MERSEIELVVAAKAGDEQAFGRLYDLYVDKIYRYIYYKIFHTETAQDLTSQTFLKAYEKLASFNESKGNFSSWVYTIAKNTLTDHFRSSKPTQEMNEAFDVSDLGKTRFQHEMNADLTKVYDYIQTLDEVVRDVMILRLWEELSYREIAEIVGKKEDHSKVIFSRGLKELRNKLPLELYALLLLLTFH